MVRAVVREYLVRNGFAVPTSRGFVKEGEFDVVEFLDEEHESGFNIKLSDGRRTFLAYSIDFDFHESPQKGGVHGVISIYDVLDEGIDFIQGDVETWEHDENTCDCPRCIWLARAKELRDRLERAEISLVSYSEGVQP